MAGTNPGNLTSRGVHVSAPLSDMSVGYHPEGLIAESVFPIRTVKKENDLYYKWDKGQRFRIDRTDGYGTLRADKSRAKVRNYGTTLASYVAEEFALATEISEREYQNADSALQLEISKVHSTQDEILLDYEIRVATICTTAANNSSSVTISGVSQWNNASFASQTNGQHSVIAGLFQAAISSIITNTGGKVPNVVVIPYNVATIMNNDLGLVDLIKYTRNDLLVEGLLPPVLWGMKVLIPRGQYTSTNEGEAFSGTTCWGKNVWCGYVNQQMGLDDITYGATFRSRQFRVKTWREEERDVTMFEPSFVQAEALVAADCGYLMAAVIA